MDADNWPVTLTFDLVEGRSPLMVGMDIIQYSNTCNRERPRKFLLKDRTVSEITSYILTFQMTTARASY